MKLNEKLEVAFNRQLNLEFESYYSYLQMSAWFDDHSFPGFSHWMRMQAEEELSHAMKFYDYLLGRGNHVKLLELDSPHREYDSPSAAFATALEHEKKVSRSIQNLYKLATEENDYACFDLLQWFLSEQVEEEESVSQILDQLELAGDDGGALLMLDRELGGRGPDAA